MGEQFLQSYGGQTTDELLAMAATHRIDSLVLAFEQAIQEKPQASTEERYILAIEGLEREVNNGGYGQFFVNSSGEFAAEVEAALRAINCPKTADITRDAIAAIAPDGDLDPQRLSDVASNPSDRMSQALQKCDDRYFANDEPETIPGVQRAAAMQGLPPFRQVNANDVDFEGYTFTPGSNDPIPNVDYYQMVTADYFETMGIPLKDGRLFNAGDAIGGPVVVVNEALVKRFYKDGNALGKRLNPYLARDTLWFTIVGIVKDVKQGGLENPAGTELYFLYDQLPRIAGFAPSQMNVVLKSSRPIEALAPSIRRAVREIDPALPVVQLRTFDQVLGASVTRQRFLAMLLAIFAVVALTLAAIGTYGILSYMVTERQREIGIRMALGAGHGQVIGLILGQGLGIAIAGIVIGVVGAYALSSVTSSLLYGVSPSDPLTYGGVAGIIALVAAAACVIPTRRAIRVDPLEAIRAD